MSDLVLVANVAIIFGVIYKLFELFVGKKERMMLIEKLSSEQLVGDKRVRRMSSSDSFSPLRWGCLLMGLGTGLLAGYAIGIFSSQYKLAYEEMYGSFRFISNWINGACVLLFGGLGLVIAFVIERRIDKEKEE